MIEHNDIEVEEPVEEPTAAPDVPLAHQHQHRPSAHDVILAAVAQRLPCATCGSLETCRCIKADEVQRTTERAALIEQALVLYGYLPGEDDDEDAFDPEETSRWLADRSGFPRYTQVVDGWHRIMESEADVELATIKALKRVPTDEVEMVKAAKAAMLAWHSARSV